MSRHCFRFQSRGISLIVIQLHLAMSNSVISNSPLLELFLAPLSSNQPRLSRTLVRSEEKFDNISREVQARHLLTRCTEPEKCIDVFAVTKAKSDWLDLPLRMQKATSCRYWFVSNFRDETISPEIWYQPGEWLSRTPAISNYFSIPWEFEMAGFFCWQALLSPPPP